MSKLKKVLELKPDEQEPWLIEHLPNRICAARVWLPGLVGDWEWRRKDSLPVGEEHRDFAKHADGNMVWCICRAAEHGQKAAMRWLIEFVGIAMKNDRPDRPSIWDGDVSIQSFVNDGSDLQMPLDLSPTSKAWILAKTWKGCTQSSVHATSGSKHRADPPELTEAFPIVVAHIQERLYSPRGGRSLSAIAQAMR